MTGATVSARLTPNTQNLRGRKCDARLEPRGVDGPWSPAAHVCSPTVQRPAGWA